MEVVKLLAIFKNLEFQLFIMENGLKQHALGRAEWIKFFGLLFGKEKKQIQFLIK